VAVLKPLAKGRRPLRHEQDCPDCEGRGRFLDRDWDEHGQMTSWATCEGCDGSGKLVDCALCDEPTPATVHELNSGYCGGCAADLASGDAEAERERIRRIA
jgi:RecJ-like exonuclease